MWKNLGKPKLNLSILQIDWKKEKKKKCFKTTKSIKISKQQNKSTYLQGEVKSPDKYKMLLTTLSSLPQSWNVVESIAANVLEDVNFNTLFWLGKKKKKNKVNFSKEMFDSKLPWLWRSKYTSKNDIWSENSDGKNPI